MSKQNMKKKQDFPGALPHSSLTVGLDIAYGVVKAVTHEQTVTFPSIDRCFRF
ncbi:MAG: hypothetical protein MUF38_05085 [Anaerolineae bacterium]|jgi:hypothetical protein|nr:hypothetical protein [Anaerolineae bacterium]